MVAADAWTDGRCALTCSHKRRSLRPLLYVRAACRRSLVTCDDTIVGRCDEVRRLMKAGETLWASDHRALVVDFRCA